MTYFDRDIAFGDLSHIESNGGNHVFGVLTGSDEIDEGGLAGVLQTDQGQFHFFFPEQTLEPVENALNEGEHDRK